MFSKKVRSSSCIRSSSGFTLSETLMAVSLFALASGLIIPAFGTFTRNMAVVGNYANMSQVSRNSLEILARDIRAANTLSIATATQINFTLHPDADSYIVDYTYDGANRELTRTVTSADGTTELSKRVLIDNLTEFEFAYYNRLEADVSQSASVLTESKNVRISAKLEKKVLAVTNSDYIISARFMMRNVD